MTTAKAIANLRERMGLTQSDFADRLGVTITSVSRYENGREPSRQILKKLAALADSAKLVDLRDYFTSKWKAGVIARIEKLKSAGTQRRVPLEDLKRWEEAPRFIAQLLSDTKNAYMEIIAKTGVPVDQGQIGAANRMMSGVVKDLLPQLSSMIEPYIGESQKKETHGKKAK